MGSRSEAGSVGSRSGAGSGVDSVGSRTGAGTGVELVFLFLLNLRFSVGVRGPGLVGKSLRKGSE